MSILFNDSKYTKWYYNIIQNAQNRNEIDKNLYYEKHHIVPKSLGGDNKQDNLILLTGKEHFVCHWLLTKMTSDKNKYRMEYAFCFMRMPKRTKKEYYKIPGYLYEKLKINFAILNSKTHKGKIVSKEARENMSKAMKGRISQFKGKKHTNEAKLKQSIAAKKRPPKTKEQIQQIVKSRSWYRHSDETKQKISEGNKGKTFSHTEEAKRKISLALKGRKMPEGFGAKVNRARIGVSRSKEVKLKISLACQNQKRIECIHCSKITTGSNSVRWHGDNCKFKQPSTP